MGKGRNKRKKQSNKKIHQVPIQKIEELLKNISIPSKLPGKNTKKLRHTEIQTYLILNPKIVADEISTRFFEISTYLETKSGTKRKSSCCDFIGCDPTLKKRAYIVEAKESLGPKGTYKSYKQLRKQSEDKKFENMETRLYGAFGIKSSPGYFVLFEYVQGLEGKIERLDKIGIFEVRESEKNERFSRIKSKITERMKSEN